jgi:hypothetical protein
VVGVGSVGTRAWVPLMLGKDSDDPLLLQIKEAQPSVLENFLPRSGFANAGQRVAVGQRLMQANGDVLLGWQRFDSFDNTPRDSYVRQLRDWKGSVEAEQLTPPVRAIASRSPPTSDPHPFSTTPSTGSRRHPQPSAPSTPNPAPYNRRHSDG